MNRTRPPYRIACPPLLALVWIALLATAAGGETWYAERISSGESPVRVEYFWSKGSRLRSEAVFAGHPIVTIVSGDRYVMIDRISRTGVSIERSPKAVAQDAGRGRPFGNELARIVEMGAERIRAEEHGGASCDLYRVTDSNGRREVCVTQDEQQLPVFIRVWLRRSGRRAESRYLEWSRDLEISDVFFTPPPDVQLERWSYADYLEKHSEQPIGPAPPLHAELLHGF